MTTITIVAQFLEAESQELKRSDDQARKFGLKLKQSLSVLLSGLLETSLTKPSAY